VNISNLFIKRPIMTALVTFAVPRHAFADITGFLGVNTTPSNRQTKGFAIGAGLLIVGFEFEYANTNEDLNTGAPSLTTGLGSVLLQTPVALGGFQPYFETGGGYYREELGTHRPGIRAGTGGGVRSRSRGRCGWWTIEC
jgi:hypothetical protein